MDVDVGAGIEGWQPLTVDTFQVENDHVVPLDFALRTTTFSNSSFMAKAP